MSANVYIDGFNLYYGSLRGTSYKWLDLSLLCQYLLPDVCIHRIRYFTARVSPSPHDPGATTRQNTYLRALRTLPNLTIHLGHFVRWPRLMPQFPLAYPNGASLPQAVQVQKTEEKGSDVNLGVYLVRDCFMRDFDEAVVVSNDSDLCEAVRIVVQDGGCHVTTVNPHRRNRASRELMAVSTSTIHRINPSVIRRSQFPEQLKDAVGTFHRPASWA